ncbi:MarP family serine protease [Nocardioides alcanivorans]|uniref:MarP family serine protease n=1 Tax=Nocardioides alcanivorans TaxID=2897352 RepID=UPI001F397401|nr:MarP family serine protease [Nocardioides alcanivorans]
MGAGCRGERLTDRRGHSARARVRRAGQGRPSDARPGQRGAQRLQHRRRHQLLPALPRALRPRAHRRGEAPDTARIMRDPDVRDAAASVVKIHGESRCDRGVEGSGFVYAAGRVMTNAHVVAGVTDPTVLVGDDRHPARVVHYDSDLDIAVLAVDGLDAPALSFEREVGERANVAVLGYPEDGPYDVQAGRVRAEQRLRSPDIYNEGSVIREVLSLRALIRPGNSGGPVVNTNGDVVGVVFAASVTDKDTGYAVTADAVSGAADAGRTGTRAVDTGDCTG